MKTALIFDLDNTIYPVNAIAGNLFAELFALLDRHAEIINKDHPDTVARIKEEMTRRPFQYIVDKYGLKAEISKQMEETLRNMTYDLPMQPFEDYHSLKKIQLDRYLVTTGYPKLQYSKIRQLGIVRDFREIYIVDPDKSRQTKKDVFASIMGKYDYLPEQLLVIGDDPDSEIKAALELGIDTFLFDPRNRYEDASTTHRSPTLKNVLNILN
ncbi:MAG: HAD family hydrolase [Bacteroidetes bacterium]|nr:HAD family hydrolase [Bacteroidota bacterium]